MQMNKSKSKIVKSASELFYKQGYQATGINELIDNADIAKASFYANFPSKSDVCLAYLKATDEKDFEELKKWIAAEKAPLERFLAPMKRLPDWLLQNDCKGCAFINLVPEIADPTNPLRAEIKLHYQRLGLLFEQLSRELVEHSPGYSRLDSSELANGYLSLFAGAIVLSTIFHDPKPAEQAMTALLKLIQS